MLQHNRSVHLDQPFFCLDKSCNHRYKSQKALKAHIKEHHEKVFKFKCTVCRQKFIHKAQYNTHLTRHTNVKPFACNHCKNAAYTTATQLTQHVAMCMFGSPNCICNCLKLLSNFRNLLSLHSPFRTKIKLHRLWIVPCVKTVNLKDIIFNGIFHREHLITHCKYLSKSSVKFQSKLSCLKM